MGKFNFSFLLMNIVLLIMFIGLTFIVFDLHRFFFVAELVALGVFLLATLIGMTAVYNDKSWGWVWLSIVSVLVLIDLLLIFLVSKTKSFALTPTVVTAIIGFIVSLISTGEDESEEEQEHQMVEKVEPPKKAVKKTASKASRKKKK